MRKPMYEHIKANVDKLEVDFDNGLVLNRKVRYRGDGYIDLSLGGKCVLLHQVIAFLKYGEECIGLQVNHLDGDKLNNTPDNLEVVTPSENLKHAYRTGLTTNKPVMTPDLVVLIRGLHEDGMSVNKLADKFELTRAAVSLAVNRKSWKHVN